MNRIEERLSRAIEDAPSVSVEELKRADVQKGTKTCLDALCGGSSRHMPVHTSGFQSAVSEKSKFNC